MIDLQKQGMVKKGEEVALVLVAATVQGWVDCGPARCGMEGRGEAAAELAAVLGGLVAVALGLTWIVCLVWKPR